MARKADELLADLDQLGSEEQPEAPPSSAKSANPAAAAAAAAAAGTPNDEDDAFAEIEKQLKAKPAAGSRPGTPRVSSSTTSGTKRTAEYTPASTSVGSSSERNSSEDRARAHAPPQTRSSGEASRSSHPAAQQTPPQPENATTTPDKASGGGGGWWGSMFSAASAAVKQAETLAKDLRGNEEALKWADQLRGQYQNLQSIGTDLRSRALPTFTSLISHIAPPISAHERLQIHTTHDIQNYPSLDPLIYSTFSRIMSQVEGGDLLVIQRGSESRNRSSSDAQGYKGGVLGSGSSWTDGPWWREEGSKRSLGAVPGLKEGTRLTRVSAESYAKEFFDARGGVEEAAKRATETLSESNPTRSSDIFLAIQAISYAADKDFFAGDAHAAEPETIGVVDPEEGSQELVVFAVYLYDPLHSLSFRGLSQPFPQRWADWLDAEASAGGLPESIVEIIQSGGVDPREWVAEWMEEILSLAVGVVAQQYVAKRMGVGEGGIGRGKKRVEEEAIGGEAARAI
ncbi:maintenance of telomere capping 1-like [Lecanosticta acicola]|uniref:Maintenance of telomere capping 1-like n=1 Tax=Lecanosticta acicola TaxID=111012 RepID=A0AAI8Z6M6_9PEZI|nr:maintenance of telomere capping 1-like [Lecanosticta acicola]